MVTISTGSAGAENRQDDEGEDQRRHRQQEIDEARQRLIDPAADDGGGEAGDDADGERQRGDDQREADRHARAIDQAAQEIAAEIVEAEPVLAVRVRPGVADRPSSGRRARSAARISRRAG